MNHELDKKVPSELDRKVQDLFQKLLVVSDGRKDSNHLTACLLKAISYELPFLYDTFLEELKKTKDRPLLLFREGDVEIIERKALYVMAESESLLEALSRALSPDEVVFTSEGTIENVLSERRTKSGDPLHPFLENFLRSVMRGLKSIRNDRRKDVIFY